MNSKSGSAYLSRHPVLRRVLLSVLAALALFFVLYWGAANYLLNRGEPLKFAMRSTKVEIRVESGWSIWPGVLNAKGAFFQVQDYNIELQIKAKHAQLDFAPTSALRGIVHIESLRARGTRVRMLARVKDPNSERLRMAAFPPLSERPSYYDEPRKFPPKSAKLKIDEIDARLSELWMMEYRAQGDIRAAGKVEVVKKVEISNVLIGMNEVNIHVGDKLVADHVNTTIKASMGPFPPLGATGKQVLTSIDAAVALDMQVRDLSVAELYSPDGPLRLEGTSHVTLNLKARGGKLLASSSAKIASPALDVSLEGQTFPFELDVELSAPGEDILQISSKIIGRESKDRTPYAWGASSILIEAELEQPEAFSLKPKQGSVKWEKALLTDPTLLRVVAGDKSLPLIKVADFSGRVFFQSEAEQGNITLENAKGNFAIFPAEKISIACQLEASTSCAVQSDLFACTDTKVACLPLYAAREKSRAQMTVRLEAPQLSREAKGTFKSTLNFSGSNPKELLLDVAAASVLEKLGVGAAPLGPLSGSASLTLMPAETGASTIVADLSRFESGALSLRGHLVSAESLKSHWLLELGEIKVGVRQSDAGVKLELNPSQAWLEMH